MPLHSIPTLCQSMIIDPALLHIICAPITHPNIKYTVSKVALEHVVHKTIKVFNSICLEPEEHGIIYMTSIKFMHEVAQLLHIPTYTSCILSDDKENKERKSHIFQDWHSGKVHWVAATICFAEGVDFPSVQYAIIVEPLDILLFLQESGRLGCDGFYSEAIMIWSTVPHPTPSDDPDHNGHRPMAHFLKTNTCRHLTFQLFNPDMHSCTSSSENAICDRCSNLSKVIRCVVSTSFFA